VPYLLGRETIDVAVVEFPIGLALHFNGDCTVVRGAGAASRTLRARSSVKACDAGSFGRPAPLPSGKSENRNRGTPTNSTISFAHPMTMVEMRLLQHARGQADALVADGQLGTRIAASTPSALQRATISGQSVSSVTRWPRLVGAPWKRAATDPMRPEPPADAIQSTGSRRRGPRRSCACGRWRCARCAVVVFLRGARVDSVELGRRIVGRPGP